jgi:hypothetical protein
MGALFDDRDNSPLLSRASIDAMIEVAPATADALYARGWSVYREGNDMVYGHGGSLPGTITTARWASNGLAMVALLNTRKPTDDFELDGPISVPQHDLFESVGISGEAVGAALAESWIPVVAAGGGAGGSLWRSDVAMLNRSALDNLVRIQIEMPALAVDRLVELRPGEQLTVVDVVSDLGLAGSGSLRVFSAEPLTVTSRIYNASADGTFGQFLGGVTGPGGLGNGESAVLMHLREDDDARSNIGILNAGRRAARVALVLHDGSGAEVARFNRRVEARQVRQLNQPFLTQGGRSDLGAGYAVLEVLDGEEIVAYGSVVDAGTNDPTTIPMKISGGSVSQWVAAVASSDGVAGSVWRSDLGLLNTGPTAVDVSVVFRPPGVPNRLLEINLQPGEHRVLDDVVGRLGSSGSGPLEITADDPILVSSRTYNRGEGGTFGQFLDGAPSEAMVGEGGRVWLSQLIQNTEFRTNIGLLNTGGEPARARIHLHQADGVLVATVQRNLTSGALLQLQEPFERLGGRSDIVGGYAVIEVTAGTGIVAYASVVDNRTNDPTTVPMVR